MDATWPDSAVYACPCGTMYTVTHWRWVDAVTRPDLLEQVQRDGPYEGACPSCGTTPRASAPWLRIDASAQRATLFLSEERRGAVLAEMREHLTALERRAHAVAEWLLTPSIEFVSVEPDTQRRFVQAQRTSSRRGADSSDSLAAKSGELILELPKERTGTVAARVEMPDATPAPVTPTGTVPTPLRASSSGATQLRRPAQGSSHGAPTPAARTPSPGGAAGIPQVIGADRRTPRPARVPSLGAYMANLGLGSKGGGGGTVLVQADVPEDVFAKWRDAKLDARPIHLRGRGYPLLGVRLIGFYMGQRGVIDAIIDVANPDTAEIFRTLAKKFLFVLDLRDETGQSARRDVMAKGLESNAALCLESARGLLARGDYPPEEYERARQALAASTAEQRLEQTKSTIHPGSYRHIVGASEAVAALEHLDRVSHKESLSRLLEVDGLPMAEYDKIRRGVLAGSLEHGLVAPRRFWRRVVASGLTENLQAYADRLAEQRELHEGEEGDLPPAQAKKAWEDIRSLCDKKNLRYPEPLRRALDIAEHGPRPRNGAGFAVSGQVGSTEGEAELARALRDPAQRLKVAADVLQGHVHGELESVFEALDDFETDELLALLPDLSELGVRAVPLLIDKLESTRREVRQSATILLGMALDPGALEALSQRLVREPTSVWLDVARALGAFGPVALRRLCQVLNREAAGSDESRVIERVARALAEIALSDGDVGPGDPSPAHDAVAALADSADPRVSTAARRALATLRDVSDSAAAIRGELPLTEVTEVRGFARRAYEAIMVPEVEVEVEA